MKQMTQNFLEREGPTETKGKIKLFFPGQGACILQEFKNLGTPPFYASPMKCFQHILAINIKTHRVPKEPLNLHFFTVM